MPQARALADLKSVEGDTLTTTANPEGYVSVEPTVVDPPVPLTIVSQVAHDGLGGPLAVEVYGGRGLWKALLGDFVVELSNGGRYVLPLELAVAVQAAIPPDPPVADVESRRKQFYGLETEEERLEREKKLFGKGDNDKERRPKATQLPADPHPHSNPNPTSKK